MPDLLLRRGERAGRGDGWCMNARRNARDYERLPQHSEAHLNWALITMMTRRLTCKKPPRKLVGQAQGHDRQVGCLSAPTPWPSRSLSATRRPINYKKQ
jgi:hypothetical protein